MLASFLTGRWLAHSYSLTHPKSPQAELGYVHALCERQECFFVNDIESTGLVLLQLTGIFALVAALASLVTGGVRIKGWGVPVSEYTDYEKREHANFGAVACGSLAVFALIFYMRGAAISAFLVSLGIVLDV